MTSFPPRRALWLVITLLLAPVTGCAVIPSGSVPPPKTNVQNVSVERVSTDGFTLGVQLALTNVAERSIPINRVNYDFLLQKTKILSGTANLDAQIPPGGTKTVRFDVPVGWADVRKATQAITSSGDLSTVPYTIDGTMPLPDIPLIDSVPVHYSGTLNLSDLLGRLVKMPQALQNADVQALLSELKRMAPDQLPSNISEMIPNL